MNRAFLIGNLTRDPETTTTANGLCVCKFTVAVSRRFNSADGNRETDFIPVVCWRGQAENCGKFLRKGSKVAVVGAIQTRSYEANDGSKRFVTEINADEVEFLTKRGEDDYIDSAPAPEIAPKKVGKISNLKPIDDSDLPF